MAMYMGEEQVWKCPKHPSKRHRNGICPVCLRDRLVILCPDCANVRPCSCYAASSSSSSSSSSLSFSFFSSLSSSSDGGGGRVLDLINSEPAFRRSRSVGFPYIFSRFAADKGVDQKTEPPIRSNSKLASFWSRFKMNSSRRRAESENNEKKLWKEMNTRNEFDQYVCRHRSSKSVDDFGGIMAKSRSIHVEMTTTGDMKASPAAVKKGWSFPSPMKVFRHSSKASKVIQDRSPRVCRS